MPFDGDPLAFYGRNIIRDYHARLKTTIRPGFNVDGPNPPTITDGRPYSLQEQKVGILGAGIGGLYTTLILNSLDIEYEILEASNRTGGRISTYKFPGGGKYDYSDMGAMRFPLPKKDSQGRYKNGMMKRLAKLIDYGPLNEGQNPLRNYLIPYYYRGQEGSHLGWNYYNGIHEAVSNTPKSPFGAQGMGVEVDYIRAGTDAIMNDITEPFLRMLVRDMQTEQRKGWEVLMENDSYSLRSYMTTKYLPSAHLELPPRHLPNNVVNWCQLLASRTVDSAFAEFIFHELSNATISDINYGDVEWKCLEGGSGTLPKKIEEYLNKEGNIIRFDKRVTAITQSCMVVEIPTSSPDSDLDEDIEDTLVLDNWIYLANDKDKITDRPASPGKRIEVPSVAVTLNGNETRHYSHVISTLPLPILRNIDLSGASLNILQKNALHMLEYANAVKIGVLFKSNWWTTKLGIVGGQSYTDLPIRGVVYPSHGVNSCMPSRVLIASYNTRGDSDQLGVLATSTHREALKDLVLRNLAELHSGLHPDVTYTYLCDQFVDMHVQDWKRDEYAMGAYARFGPGVFQDMYASLTYPAAGKRLHFAGEGLSTRHAWVVGALDSAWRAVYSYLKVTEQNEKMVKFRTIWGEEAEWSSKSPLVETSQAQARDGRDLLDEHLELVYSAVPGNVTL